MRTPHETKNGSFYTKKGFIVYHMTCHIVKHFFFIRLLMLPALGPHTDFRRSIM